MTRYTLFVGLILLIPLLSSCATTEFGRPNRDFTAALSPCPTCPEKVCPACPSCEPVPQQDKPLVVDEFGIVPPSSSSKDRHHYYSYRVINPNDRRVLVRLTTYCYDINNTETIFEETHFIDGRSEYYDAYRGARYFVASCHGDWHRSGFKWKIID